MSQFVDTQSQPRTEDSAVREDARLLAQIVAIVRHDSQSEPQKFLAETVVPHGGE